VSKNICVIDGHPDPSEARFIHALCDEYCIGAAAAGHQVSRVDIASLDFTPLRNKADFATEPGSIIQHERSKLAAADHVTLMFPLWLGSMPSATRAFFEQAARASFFLDTGDNSHQWPQRMMKGKSARVVVTMGMPSIAYKMLFGSASLKAIEKGLFGISGFKPIKHTILGAVESANKEKYKTWLAKMRKLGVLGI